MTQSPVLFLSLLLTAVVVMCASGDAIRRIMLAAHDLGMTKGEYAFFNIFLFDSNYFGDVSWRRNDGRDEDAKEAYRSLMTFTLRKPDTPKFATFAQEVKQKALERYNFSFDDLGEEVRGLVYYTDGCQRSLLITMH